jgi:hypothetical protein
MFLYALKIDMDRLFSCLDDMEGFPYSNITHTPTLYINPSHPHFILIFLVEFQMKQLLKDIVLGLDYMMGNNTNL